jgi:hypothetical protein
MILMKVQMCKLVYYVLHERNANLGVYHATYEIPMASCIYICNLKWLGEGIFYHNKTYNKNIYSAIFDFQNL